jgi:hypothetical protein
MAAFIWIVSHPLKTKDIALPIDVFGSGSQRVYRLKSIASGALRAAYLVEDLDASLAVGWHLTVRMRPFLFWFAANLRFGGRGSKVNRRCEDV